MNLNDRDILKTKGKISHEEAIFLAEKEYKKFNKKRINEYDKIDKDFDNAIKMLAQMLLKNQLLMTSSIKTIDMRIPEKVIIELAKETKTGDSGSVDQGI